MFFASKLFDEKWVERTRSNFRETRPNFFIDILKLSVQSSILDFNAKISIQFHLYRVNDGLKTYMNAANIFLSSMGDFPHP